MRRMIPTISREIFQLAKLKLKAAQSTIKQNIVNAAIISVFIL